MAQLNKLFEALPLLLYVVFVMFKLHNAVLQQLFSICIADAFHHK
jgi:hypothetical protein